MPNRVKTPARPPLKTWQRWLLGLTLLGLSLFAAATFLLPRLIQGMGAKAASEALGREVTIGMVKVQPWRLGLVLQDLRIAGPSDQAPPLITLDRLDAALSLRSVWLLSPVVESLRIERPVLRLTRTAPGAYDVDDLIAKFAAKPASPPAAEPPALALYNIVLNEGQVLLEDRPVARKHELAHLNLSLPFVSTRAADIKILVQPAISGFLNGVEFGSTAEALPFSSAPEAKLQFKLKALDLQPYQPYMPAALPLRLASGRVDADLSLHFRQPPQQAPQIEIRGQIALSDFALQKPDASPWLAWQKLSIGLQDVQPFQHKVMLTEVIWQGPQLNMSRDAHGQVWLPVPVGQEAPTPAPAKTAPTAWALGVNRLVVSDGSLSWSDAAVPGQAKLQAKAVSLGLGALQWPLKDPVPLSFGLLLQPDAKTDGKAIAAELKGEGSLSPVELKLGLQWDKLALQWFAPYWAMYLPVQMTASVAGRLSVGLAQPLAPQALDRLRLGLQDVQITQLALAEPKAKAGETLLRLSAIQLDKLELDYGARRVQMGELSLDQPDILLTRAKNKAWNWLALLPPADSNQLASKPVLRLDEAAAAPAPKSAGKEWALALRNLKVDAGTLRLQDAAAPAGVAALDVRELTLRLGNLAWPNPAVSPAQLGFKLATAAPARQVAAGKASAQPAGSFSWQGSLSLAPMAASGKLRAERLPLQLLNAYMDPDLNLVLQKLSLGWQGDFNARQLAGDWQVGVTGDLSLLDLSLQQGRSLTGNGVPGTDLLSWQALNLDGIRLELKPGAKPEVQIKALRLNDFYASLAISEKGRFNLQDIRAEPLEPPKVQAPAAAPAKHAELPVQISLGQTQISKGRVDFADHFVRPNYTAQLTDLQGSLGAVRSGQAEMAPLRLRGRVAGTGLLEIDGVVNPLALPLTLDIKAAATDIELAPLSPYAEKYAGYAIERGKLSSQVAYKLAADGALQANNKIILNQLTFGEPVNSPDATQLPVLFALSLMKDSNGVIDVDLPVSGSLNDPQFSVAAVVGKLIVNMIGKALTSPFSLLGGLGGDGHDHSQIEFAAGSAQPSAPEALDKLAKMLTDRPSLALTITPWVDLERERKGLQQAQLDAAMLARRGQGTDAVPSAADRTRLLTEVYEASSLPGKPRNVLGFAKDIPAEEMRALLLPSYAVSEATARALGLARGEAVRDALIAKGLPNQRIYLATPKLHLSSAGDVAWKPRVELDLRQD